MLDTLSWVQIALISASSVLITVLVFVGLVWRDYRRDRRNSSSGPSSGSSSGDDSQ